MSFRKITLGYSFSGVQRGGANGATTLGIQKVKLQKLHFIKVL